MKPTMTQEDQAIARQRTSLLLVDPDPLLRWSVETHLRDSFEVTAVAALEQAIRMLAARAFDSIVLSIALGDSGASLVEAARSVNPHVRIVWLTAGDEPLKRDPSAVYIEKPFRLTALADVVAAEVH